MRTRSFLLAAAMALLTAWTIYAAAPISGQTLAFAGGAAPGNTSAAVNALAAADFDGDGDPDALSGDAGGALTLWQNTGSGWTSAALGSAAAPVSALAARDLDGDGDPDVLSGSGDASGALTAWQNNGSPFGGAWASAAAGTSGAPVGALTPGDFDGDGDADFLSGDSSGALTAWQNSGSPFAGAWNGLTVQASGTAIQALAAADYDLDGDSDLLSGHALDAAAAEVQAWENLRAHLSAAFAASNNGAGSTSGSTIYGLAAADLDGDGDLDLASGDFGGNVYVWQNDGTPFSGVWNGNLAGSAGAVVMTSISSGDVDGDGDPDLVSGNTGGAVRLWQNDGTPFSGAWSQTVVGSTSGGANAVALGDMDGDGDLDIVSAHSVGATAEVIVWRNDGGTWTRFDVGTHDADMNTVALADLDGDGDLDIASSSTSSAAAGEVMVWQNNGLGGTWTRQDLGELGTFVFALDVADLDHDGNPDVVSGDGSNNVIAWQNDGTPFNGAWTGVTLGAAARTLRGLTIADWNADGWPDVLTGDGNGNVGGAVRLWTNNGAPFGGAWSGFTIAGTGDNPNALPAGDLDGDGDLDFAVGFSSDTDIPYEVAVWEFTGGQAAFQAVDTSPASPSFIPNGTEDDLMRLTLTHNGVSGDPAAEWAQAAFTLYRSDCLTPLTPAEANAFIDALRVRRDDGDGVFSASLDTLIGEAATLSPDSNGVQTLAFTDGDPNAQVGAAASAVFWVSVLTTADADAQNPNNLCLQFDPDADALVEAKYASGDASLSITDSAPVNTNNTPTAVSLQSFSVRSPASPAPLRTAGAVLLLGALVWAAARRIPRRRAG